MLLIKAFTKNIITVITIRMVEMAEITGLISYFNALKIIFGKVIVFLFVMNRETTDSSKDVINANSILVKIAGFTSGNTTLIFAVKWFAPKLLAASYKLGFTPESADVISVITIGIARHVCARMIAG